MTAITCPVCNGKQSADTTSSPCYACNGHGRVYKLPLPSATTGQIKESSNG